MKDKDTRVGGGAGVRAFGMRPIQLDALDAVRATWKTGHRRALLVLPTGVGKTITALEAVRRTVAASSNGRVLWLAHREELVTQPLSTVQSLDHFAEVAKVAGLVKGNRNEVDARVVFTSVQTMHHRGADYLAHGAPSMVVIDEAHHYVPDMQWGQIALSLLGADEEGAGGAFALGLTATPERADSLRLSMMWGSLPAFAFSMQEAIDDGYLVPPDFRSVPFPLSEELEARIAHANSEEGDDEDADLALALLNEGIAEHVVGVMDGLRGRPSIVFCMSVAQVKATHGLLTKAGHRCDYVTGTTSKTKRAATLAAYTAGELDVIVNCGVLTEGTDLPRTSEVVLARPCGSKTLYIQIVGRGARLSPGKESFRVWDTLGASGVHTLISSVVLDIGRDVSGEDYPTWVATREHRTNDYHAPKSSAWKAQAIRHGDVSLLRLHSAAEPKAGRPGGRMMVGGPIVVGLEGWAPMSTGGGKRRVPDVGRDRQPWRPRWIDVGPGVRALSVGEYGTAYTVRAGNGKVWPVIAPPRARKPRTLNSRPVSEEVASAIVAEVARSAAKLVDSEAEWRGAPASDGQRRYLDRLGIDVEPRNRGHAERLISEVKAKSTARRLGLVDGWTP